MKKQHSVLGVISFLLGLIVPLSFALAAFYPQLEFSHILATAALIPVGLVTGIIALVFKNDKQIFSVLGILINSIWLCLMGYLVYDFIAHPQWRMF